MFRSIWSATILGLATLVTQPLAADPPKLTLAELDQQLKMIKPNWSESGWSQIPWMIDLNAARKKAAAEGKPLYVWSMSGEPLGQC